MTIQSLFILNKSGGLIFQKDVSRRLPAEEGGRESRKKPMGMNEKMMAGSTFHGLSQIAASVSPEMGAFGIVRIVTDTYVLQCFESLTGTKFFVAASKSMSRQHLKLVLDKVYQLYADYVLKNPFYELEQPIQCEKFDIMLDRSLKMITPSGGGS